MAAYIGTRGMTHSLETIVEAAERMRDVENLVFLFAGGGAAADGIERLIEEKGLANVVFLGRQDKSMMSLCDVSIVHLKNSELFAHVIPSKIFESFAMGLPVLIGVPEGEATGIVRENAAGVVIEPEDAEQMVEAIRRLMDDTALMEQYRKSCLQAARKYDRERLAMDMLGHLKGLIARPSTTVATDSGDPRS